MRDQEAEDLKLAMRLSTQQHEPPEPKRSKPGDCSAVGGAPQQPEESPEVMNRRRQREIMAAAAERRMEASKIASAAAVNVSDSAIDVKTPERRTVEAESTATTAVENVENLKGVQIRGLEGDSKGKGIVDHEVRSGLSGSKLSILEANKLFWLIFGNNVTKDVLAQWCNQGIRFSADPDTSMGLVQHEGGPCGVLAALQAFVLKYLLFVPKELENTGTVPIPKNESVSSDTFPLFSEGKRSRALVRSMSEILLSCGRKKRAVIAYLNIHDSDNFKSMDASEDEVIAKALNGLSVDTGSGLQTILRVETCTSQSTTLEKLEALLPFFRSRMGVLLFLISALLSRGLDYVQVDRDDPSQPLVTAPFGHASQEIVNLLLSGSAVANVFDGKMDLGGGMFVKGISTAVQVGFLTLVEALNLCKVGEFLKCPRWPIWVVGSESHYTVLFALDTNVQEDSELENRELQIRRAFDAQDQSGGGGFVSVEGFNQVVKEMNIKLPQEKVNFLSSTGVIVWSEFLQALVDLDTSLGGIKHLAGVNGRKVFDLYHFNGIAKPSGNENPMQRPRLTKLTVSAPPRWTPEEFMADKPENLGEPTPSQYGPLVDCVRTRWPRSVCNWEGDAPSIV
ncbi:uncharacterized protein LOC127265288 isoform X2 [Andrographis paniculata]|nr:uncharacterized protein LOC127265288 isoform X2 [Andrographis paniculata]XP_051150980.1 uncharacterized protein LOC127265288 isoform X2 [Andrographis paniculata]XP_051150981.1 uncharacterized protein LOC127265288 isoform X2 [Andrographis paniculata]